MALGIGIQGPMTSSSCKQNMNEHTPITQTSIKKLTSQSKIILFHCELQDFLPSLEGLNNSLAQAAGELWPGMEYISG